MKDNEMMVGAILIASVILLAGMVVTANQIGKHIDNSKVSEENVYADDQDLKQWIEKIDTSGGRIALITGEVFVLTASDSIDLWSGGWLFIMKSGIPYHILLSSVIYFS